MRNAFRLGCVVLVVFFTVTSFAPPAHADKVIYLTFDMDMNGFMFQKTQKTAEQWYDSALFTYLEQNNIPATFFVSGLFAVAYPDLIKNLATDDNFSFQNHSYDESSFTPNCYWLKTLDTDDEKEMQISETEAVLKEDTGQTATYFRFPGVCRDAQNIALVKSLGYTINDGTVISGDPFNKNTDAIVDAVLDGATSSASVIMHVGGPNAPESLAALQKIVPKLKAEGYEFEKL